MKIKLLDNPGKPDDLIRRGTAIAIALDKEGSLLSSLWYVPPSETASEIWDAADPESANVIIENMIEHAMNWSTIAEIVSCIAPLCDELSPEGAIKVLKQLVICRDCRHRLDLHYEKEGEKPYIKCICESKYGLKKPYQVSPVDFCSRGERNENDSSSKKDVTKMEETYELKSCPFCGHEPHVESYQKYDGYQGEDLTHAVICRYCGATMEYYTLEGAVEKWNNRAIELDAVEYSIARDRMCRSLHHNCSACKLFSLPAGCRVIAEAPISPFAVMYVNKWKKHHERSDDDGEM